MQKIWHKWWQWGQTLVTRVLIANMILVLSPINLDFLILTHRLSPPWTRYKVLPDHKAGLAALPDREGVGNAGHHTLPFSILPHKAHTHTHAHAHAHAHTYTHTREKCSSADGKAVDGRDQSRSRLVWLLVYQRFLLFRICTERWGPTRHSWSLLSPCTFFSASCLIILSFFRRKQILYFICVMPRMGKDTGVKGATRVC